MKWTHSYGTEHSDRQIYISSMLTESLFAKFYVHQSYMYSICLYNVVIKNLK